MNTINFRRTVAWLVMATMTLTQSAQVVALTLSSVPLAASTTSVVRPNLMYVLDDSGSMAWDYTPDYINDSTTAADPGSAGGTVGDGVRATISGGAVTSIVATSPPFNTVYRMGAPAVVIEGGGGTGASAVANLNASNVITSITVTDGGSGYVSVPYVALVGGMSQATWGMCWGTTSNNAGGIPKDTTVSPSCTTNTQPPYAAAPVNYQYYDPAVKYEAPLKADGTRYPIAPSPWTAIKSDGFAQTGSVNVASGWTHEVWCNTATPGTAPTAANIATHLQCKENLDTSNNTLYPNATYTYRKTYTGPASYYVMNPTWYCTDSSMTNCQRSTTPVVIGAVAYNVPGNYRWCSYYNPLTHAYGSCQASRDLSHYVPDYLGGWVSTGSAGVQATATLTINSVADGQSLTGLTIGGQSVVGGLTFAADATSTTTTIAAAVCNAIQANLDSTGYGCSQTGNNILLQAAVTGTAANGAQVLATGPADVAATNSIGSIDVLTATANYEITGITITRTDASTAQLINSTVVADGNIGNTAQFICQAINSGPNQGVYIARSGNPLDPLLTWGTCNSTVDGYVGIKRVPTDTVDNSATITVTGPTVPPATISRTTGTISIDSTGGATRIDDITLGVDSILPTKPLSYADGTLTTTIAADVASKISVTDCTATSSGRVVTLSGTCAGALAVVATGASAVGTFRVAPGSTGYAGALGGISVGTTDLVGTVSSSQITDSSAAATNSGTLRTLLNNATAAPSGGVGPHGFTAAAPVANGSNYDVTVTAPAGNSYNNQSFSFSNGTASGATAGTQPSWTFNLTGATTDNKLMTSITCGGTNIITPGTASTGNATAADYIANLATGATTNGLNGRSFNNYSYTCNASGSCTLTGPYGAAACNTPSVAPLIAVSADATITLGNWVRTGAGTTGTPLWTFNITGATTDSRNISSITCGGTNVIATNTVGTGVTVGAADYISNLVTGLTAGGTGGYSYACTTSGMTAPQQRCTVTGPAGVACGALTIAKDASISLSTTTPAAVGGSAGTSSWNFTFTDATKNNKELSTIRCGSSSSDPLMTTSLAAANTGTATATYAENLATSLIGGGSTSNFDPDDGDHWTYSSGTYSYCTPDNSAGTVACTFRKTDPQCSQALSVVPGTGLTLNSGPSLSGTDWSFTIGGATAANRTVSSITCPEFTGANTTTTSGSASAGASATAGTRATTLATNIVSNLSSTYWQASSSCAKNAGDNNVTCTLVPVAGGMCASSTAPTVSDSGLNITVTASGANWTLAISSIGSGNSLDSITCPTQATYRAVVANVGTTGASGSATSGKVQRLENLRAALNGQDNGTYSISCPTAATDAAGFSCTASGPGTCTASTIRMYGASSSGIKVSPYSSNTEITNSGRQFGSYAATGGATAPTWTFDITNATTASRTISSISCPGPLNKLSGTPSTGTPTGYPYQRINNLATGLAGNGANSYTTACTPAATAGSAQTTCTITGPAGAAACGNMTLSADASISADQPGLSPGSGSTRPTWTFDITNATTAAKTIGSITCGGTHTFDTGSLPSTGNSSLTEAQRVTNLTKGSGTGIESIGVNGYSTSCQTANAGNIPGSPGIQCTVTGPAGVAACTPLSITAEPGIAVGASTRTSAGSGPIAAVENFAPFLSTVSAFSGGYTGQGITASGMTTSTVGTISTLTHDMSSGSAASALTIGTNADGTPAGTLTMSGGAAADAATNHWTGVGIFKRIDIVATDNSYDRASGRTDCTGVTCTYNEEIQNFANWYSYYRTRMLMMKSATTLAFSQLDGKYRIGYDNICSSTTNTVLREAKQFVDSGGETANHRTNWWATMTSESPSCATPLRAETTKIGRYFAGTLNAAIDPLQYSCQQNFMLLVTDGYWNEIESTKAGVTGTDIGNVDNNLALTERPYYDGAQAATTCATSTGNRSGNCSSRTLADITHYYYNTDLRASPYEVTAVTAAAHGMKNGQTYTISGASPAGYNGDVAVYVTGASTFTYQLPGTTPDTSPGAYTASSGTINGQVILSMTHGTGHFSGAYANATNPASLDVSKNNVITSASDKNQLQHMNFYAMGLGIDGTLQYRSDYKTAGTGDYAAIVAGTKNWPAVANLDPTAVDDLWHATVNGHGRYFSARNLPNVVAGLREALNEIGARTGSASAAATSNLRPVAGDNYAYVASYGTVDWVGDLQARTIDSSGNVSPDTNCGATGSGCSWSVQTKLDNMTFSARRIYVAPSSNTSGTALRAFTYDNLSGAEQAYFNPGTAPALSQYAALVVSNPSDITAENLVNFLRGERRLEQDGNISHAQIWRKRAHVMGDIVNSQPVYMKAPLETYADAGFDDSASSFKQSGTAITRTPVVFVSAQDGMLHAINAHSAAVTVSGATVQPGEEMWAYIPKQSMAAMRVLGDVNYSHRYFVDGPITVASVNFGASSNDWHTILIGSQFGGGTSYFALDVTDPLNPLYLWEFSDSTKLGYTFGNPVIAKLPNGEWAVFFTSGFNNADGLGYLFALNPKTGAAKTGYPISNGSGSGAFPSNLGKLAIETTSRSDFTALYMYAGDLNGDLWRFNPSPTADVPAYFKLAHLTNASSTAQPITTKPELAKQSNGTRSVFVGTGKYLENNQPSPPGVSDLTNTDVQSIYAIKDTLGASNLGNAGQDTWNPQTDTVTVGGSSEAAFKQRKLIGTKEDGSPIKDASGVNNVQMICKGAASTVHTVSGADVCNNESADDLDWSIHGGWYVDFPDAGERMNVDPILVKSTLLFAGNTPSASSCTSGGEAWLTSLDYSTGLEVPGASKKASTRISGAVVVGLSVIILGSGDVKVIVTKSDYTQETLSVPIAAESSSTFSNRRSQWREFEAY